MRVGRNQPCPCGSGKKHKRCCLDAPLSPGGSTVELELAGSALLAYAELAWTGELLRAFEEFWGPPELEPELDPDEDEAAARAADDWSLLDRALPDGRRIVEHFLDAEGHRLTSRERCYLEAKRDSTVRLYEVQAVRPGQAVVLLRDVLEGTQVSVAVEAWPGARALQVSDLIAARVFVLGGSRRLDPEGALRLETSIRERVEGALKDGRARFLARHPGAPLEDFYRTVPPGVCLAWREGLLATARPRLLDEEEEPAFRCVRLAPEELEAAVAAMGRINQLQADLAGRGRGPRG